jgi:hypothetical protein
MPRVVVDPVSGDIGDKVIDGVIGGLDIADLATMPQDHHPGG